MTTRFVLQPDHATTIFDADGASVIVHELEDRGEETPPASRALSDRRAAAAWPAA